MKIKKKSDCNIATAVNHLPEDVDSVSRQFSQLMMHFMKVFIDVQVENVLSLISSCQLYIHF